jgi:hypothetical protein
LGASIIDITNGMTWGMSSGGCMMTQTTTKATTPNSMANAESADAQKPLGPALLEVGVQPV